jgi:hypothetical protein
MDPFASSAALLQSKSILCGLKKLRMHSCRARITFSRDVYAMLPLELRSVFKGYVLKMLKPLHGTKEAETF